MKLRARPWVFLASTVTLSWAAACGPTVAGDGTEGDSEGSTGASTGATTPPTTTTPSTTTPDPSVGTGDVTGEPGTTTAPVTTGPDDTTGACAAVCHGTSGHQRSVCPSIGCAGSITMLWPGRGLATGIPAARAATSTRSTGSVQPCSARSKRPQCTGIMSSPRTI